MKKVILSLITALSLSVFTPMLVPGGAVYAACPTGDSSKGQVLKGIGQTGNECDESGIKRFANSIVEIISYLAGIIAIIMILISAFKYITSGGDTGKIASAKTTLIYAIVGLAIAVLAQVLVNVVLSESNKAVSGSGQSQSQSAANGSTQASTSGGGSANNSNAQAAFDPNP